METSFDPSPYPPLACCMIVESRFGTRSEVTKTLRASQLFDTIIEPSSVSAALLELAEREVDAVIVGNSVTPMRATEFVREALRVSRASHCAFLSLATDDAHAESLRTDESYHQVLRWPCARNELSTGIISAVVAANREGLWAGVQAKQQPDPARFAPSPLERLFSGNITDLEGIVRAVQAGELGLEANRAPTKEARERLAAVINGVFSGQLRGAKIEKFKLYFGQALELWFIDLCTLGEEQARNTLRQSLFSFVESLQ